MSLWNSLSVSLTHNSSVVFQGKFVVLNWAYSGTWAQFKDRSNTWMSHSVCCQLSNWTGNLWGIGLPGMFIFLGEFNLPPVCGGDEGQHRCRQGSKGFTAGGEWAVVLSLFKVRGKWVTLKCRISCLVQNCKLQGRVPEHPSLLPWKRGASSWGGPSGLSRKTSDEIVLSWELVVLFCIQVMI